MTTYDDLLARLGANGYGLSGEERQQAEEELKQAIAAEAENAPLEMLRKLRKWDQLDFVEIEQIGTTHEAQYYGVRRDGQVVFLGSAADLLSVTKVRANIMAQTKVLLENPKKKDWEMVVDLLIRGSSPAQDIGDRERDLIGYIQSYFNKFASAAKPIPESPESLIRIVRWSPGMTGDTDMWHLESGRVVVKPDSLSNWIWRESGGERWPKKDLLRSLRLIGFEQHNLQVWYEGRNNPQRVWWSQPGWAHQMGIYTPESV